MDVRESAFRRAALLLSTIGAEYAIVYKGKEHTSGGCKFAMQTADGVMHINGLELNQKPVKKAGFHKVNDFKDTGYLDVLPLLANGESWEYKSPTKAHAIALQRAVCGAASRLWGHKSYISTVKDGTTFEILRLTPPNEQAV
jgi:hypothetical protein